ncbi:MAG: ABC transporter ATP-binding protein [Planctomycetaceae bacterium]|nr:ABC transporter ATP-binding protein [Planctomycetaceae bacterium]
MSNSQTTSKPHRIFHREDWGSRDGLLAFGWGTFAALVLLPLTFSFLFLMELVETHGEVVVSSEDAAGLYDLYDLPGKEELPEGKTVRLRNTGILPILLHQNDPCSEYLATNLFVNFEMARHNHSAILLLVGVLVASLILILFAIERNRAAVFRLTQTIEARIRRILHRQVLRLGQSDLNGEIHHRATTLFGQDTRQLGERLAQYLRAITCELALTIGLVTAGLLIDWLTFLICLLPLEAGWLLWRSYTRRGLQQRQELEDKARRDLELLENGLSTARLVRGYHMEEFEQTQFQKLIDDYHEQRAGMDESSRWTFRMGAAGGLVLFLMVLFVLVSKMTHATDIGFALPKAITIVTLLGGISLLIKDLGLVAEARKVYGEITERLNDFFNLKPQVGQAVGAKFLSPVAKSIYYESVTYLRPGDKTPLLDKLDLKIKAGEVAGIVSLDHKLARAVVSLMPRLIEPQAGRILFDGEDIAWGTLESIRAETMIVSANDPVLTGTVLENLTGGSSEYSLQDATDAAKSAHAHNFISKLPQGYETPLGVYGHPLDMGQRYRLALARAVLRNPTVLILEEPTCPLAEDVKDLLDDAYSRIFPERTVLILPGRLSSVKKADRVILLHGGRVQAVGTHASLVQNEALYRHWEYSRFNEFRDSEGC